MWLLSLLSSIIFVVPVFVTFGAYFAADYQHILECGFTNCGNTDTGGGFFPGEPGGPGGPDLTDAIYCQRSYAITPPPGRYVFNPNQWGLVTSNDSLCISFTDDGQSHGDDYAAGWAATWHYLVPGPPELPVHAFPNALLELPDTLPAELSSITGMPIDVSWNYSPGSTITSSLDETAVDAASINANVCVDMFFAPDKETSTNTTLSTFEVMVWLGKFGNSTDPLGYEDGSLETQIISGTTFDLYSKANSLGQLAFTWLADQNTTNFKGDIRPLLQNLYIHGGPTTTDYIGYMAFGSETFYAGMNATFSVPKLEMDVQVS